MVYVPGGRTGKEYAPESLVVMFQLPPVAWFCTFTVAPGTTAPVESTTMPLIPETVTTCARLRSSSPHAHSSSPEIESKRTAVLLHCMRYLPSNTLSPATQNPPEQGRTRYSGRKVQHRYWTLQTGRFQVQQLD